MGTENKGCILMQRYEIGRLLGQGTFAKVYHARNIKTSQSVAIKMIDKEKVLKVGLIDQIKREISIMRLVRHPNIVQLDEVMASKTKIYFVLEYVRGGELFHKVSKGRLKEEIARKYFHQLISAVDFCHSRGVYHRDLKPENLLIDDDGNLKVSDFGLSALPESKRHDGLLHTTCGTPAYVAPEVINRKGYDGAKADIWSCGVVLFVLMAGHLPFYDPNLMEMYRRIRKAEFKCPNWFTPDVRKLITGILEPNPATRISFAKIKENPWFTKDLGVKQKEYVSQDKDSMPKDVNAAFTSLEDNTTDGKRESMKPICLNAFDIISLSSGFDLSGLFEVAADKGEARFTSKETASTIFSKIQEVAKSSRLELKKTDGGVLKLERTKEGCRGLLALDVEIFEMTPSLHLVDIKKNNGDALEYQRLLNQHIRPALKDIVWSWIGDQPASQEQPAVAE
ncbi:hypothetical protein HPP92_011982 [Vanilla planifolia]|uniref:non-specific serine/threonine protein kinase n=1 Tax=Vanilla planifolia TaxID=51239 RepID=A0A835R2V6_VANPL|nr:hypothetical protein HPP92_011982 [Vanilla planifolia]